MDRSKPGVLIEPWVSIMLLITKDLDRPLHLCISVYSFIKLDIYKITHIYTVLSILSTLRPLT